MANNGGVSLADAVARLVPQKRGKGRLKPAADREAIGESRSESVPSNEEPGSGAGLITPWVEQEYTGSTFYHITDSSGLLMIEFGHETEMIDDDGNGDTFVIKHDDPNSP